MYIYGKTYLCNSLKSLSKHIFSLFLYVYEYIYIHVYIYVDVYMQLQQMFAWVAWVDLLCTIAIKPTFENLYQFVNHIVTQIQV